MFDWRSSDRLFCFKTDTSDRDVPGLRYLGGRHLQARVLNKLLKTNLCGARHDA